jgi:hypothetical protein
LGRVLDLDPRLTTTLLSVLVFVSVVMLRAFARNGEAERKFASALGVSARSRCPSFTMRCRCGAEITQPSLPRPAVVYATRQ